MGNVLSPQLCGEVNLIQCNVREDGETFCSVGETQILRDKMGRLSALKRDVERQINDIRDPQVEVSNVVKTWLEQVAELHDEVSQLRDTRACCFLFSKNKSGILGRIDDLLSQKDYWKDSIFMPRHRTADKDSIFIPPSADANIVGMEGVMSQVLRYLDNPTVGVVGIHGMGGAGKTTLAKQLIQRLQSSSSSSSTSAAGGQGSRKFDVIIWAVVSQNLDIGKLQEDIAAELRIHERSGFKDAKDERSRARFIADYLKERRFLLVLDDVWEKLDLRRIGIPEFLEDIGNKIVLTTRQEKVCTEMGARKSTVKVGCLGEEESWELFKKAIQWTDDEFEHVYEIARDIARKCGGLPLALITIARAMATKSDVSLWRRACDLLKDSPQSIEGMEDVYRLLEFSYNSLKKDEYKSCLLYSALFPEDYEIEIKTMVEYCIGGGSVSVDRNITGDIVSLRREGRFIISELIDACLLERGMNEHFVKVHDAIRDMILFWLKRDNGERRIVSHAGKDITGTHVIDAEEWRAASMLSFYDKPKLKELVIEGEEEDENHGKFKALCNGMFVSKVERIPWKSNHLQVLLLNSARGELKLPRRLFEYCPHVRVLDLSSTDLRSIPASLCCLKFLQYLNLSFTKIQTLPRRLFKYCPHVRLLDLSCTDLRSIPASLFCLKFLQYLNLSRTKIQTLPRRLFKYCPHVRLLDLSCTDLRSIPASLCCLKFLQYLNLSFTEIQTLPKEMRKLSSLIELDLFCTRKLDKIPNGLFSSLSKMQSLDILGCPFFTRGENRLQVLKEIGDLHLLKDVRLTIDGNDAVNFLVDESHSLSNSIKILDVKGVDLLKVDLILQRMGSRLKKLDYLKIHGDFFRRDGAGDCKEDLVIDDGHFSELKKLDISFIRYCHIILKGQALEHLTYLWIDACHKLTDLACLWKLPNLELLYIQKCDGIVELMGPSQSEGDEIIQDQSILPKVKSIRLSYCPNLLRISSGPLQLHSLNKLDIQRCPSLRDISMISSPQKLQITCEAKWWEDLRWENSGGVPPSNFIPNFHRIDCEE